MKTEAMTRSTHAFQGAKMPRAGAFVIHAVIAELLSRARVLELVAASGVR